ncbi:MAG: helicase [Candidatus Nitrosocaldaceae archaeon]|nr:MAG: helicase [Candidatus Nitrosocaldaceae archaeon]
MIIRKEIIDNESNDYKLANFINENINNSDIAIATGYFNLSGYNLVKDSLWRVIKKNKEVRIIVGKEIVDSISNNDVKLDDPALRSEIELEEISDRKAREVNDLINFLKNENVKVRKNKGKFSHAKCYILSNAVVVGSSNLTHAGLANNIELNAALYQPSAQKEVIEWFERRWNECEDFKEELIKVLEESKFGKPLEPYKMYMRFLYEYYKNRLEVEERITEVEELAEFQKDAVTTALKIIEKYNGVIIADSTGLGKTHIGLELLHELVAVKRKKALLIAPSQILRSVWEPRLLEYSIKTKNITLESTGRNDTFEPSKYIDYDIVLIDESHNYRNANINRYRNIMKILAGGKRKQVILMTATPVNNSLMDLYNQLSLITAGDDTHFAEIGIADLKRYFRAAVNKEFVEGIEYIMRILDEIMVRRTRQFIKENYPNATIEGKKITFPNRELKKIEYSLIELFGNDIYKRVIDTLDRLNLVPYRTDYYKITAREEEKKEAEQLAVLQKIGLLKRFESSIEAIRISIDRLIKFYRSFEHSLNNNRILSSNTFRKVLQEVDEEEDDEKFFEELERHIEEEESLGAYDKQTMLNELRYDLELLNRLKKDLDKIKYADKKLIVLKEQFFKDEPFERESKKVVIFTQFVSTANYLYEKLKNDLKDKRVLLLTGRTDQKSRERILKEFAPKANLAREGEIDREGDILISTDVLSEGQNLQDANYIINYDLPWNPMKIVQRVGRVDRLLSEFDTVRVRVFIPEKELEDLLGLLNRLESKIQEIADTVGIESTILGEKENPKNFNAIERIRKEDQSLIDDIEKSSELLPIYTPYQKILSYIKGEGKRSVESIPLGRYSGKISDNNGLILFYKEKGNGDNIHMLMYDYDNKRFAYYNEASNIFKKVECKEDTAIYIPIKGYDIFKEIGSKDREAREYIIKQVNAPLDIKEGKKIGSKIQNELKNIILDAFNEGLLGIEANDVYDILDKVDLGAWDDELSSILNDYKRNKDINIVVEDLQKLFKRYKIEIERKRPKELKIEDLQLIGCMFIANPNKFLVINSHII